MSDASKTPQGHAPGESPHTAHSEPVLGHHGTNFEGTDATAGMVIWSLAVIIGILIVVFLITIPLQKDLENDNPQGKLDSPLGAARIIPPKPNLQVHPWEELPDLRAHEDQVLSGYGKDADGRVHIPIEKAMDAVVSRLTVSPGAPQGITTPGGEGRDFARSINEMPAPYQRPQIQGEIQKHAH